MVASPRALTGDLGPHIIIIGPMTVQPKVKQAVRHLRAAKPGSDYGPAGFVPEKDEFPDVQGRIFRDPKGGLALVTANSRYYPVRAAFTIDGLFRNGYCIGGGRCS